VRPEGLGKLKKIIPLIESRSRDLAACKEMMKIVGNIKVNTLN
jgi:hypothetical protein